MRRILFICKGNICRSPFAAAVAHKLGLGECRSAATEDYHEGRGADPVTIEIARDYGVDLGGHVAHRVTNEDLAWAQLVFVMDNENLTSLNKMGKHVKDKAIRLLDVRQGKDVPDPYRRSEQEYRITFSMITECCTYLSREREGEFPKH